MTSPLRLNQYASVAEMARIYGEVLLEPSDQQLVFSMLLSSIAWCERLGSSAWSVTQLANGFRLNVGAVEAMTCSFSIVAANGHECDHKGASVTVRFLLAGADYLSKIALRSGETASIYEMPYTSVGESHWCYEATFRAGSHGKLGEGRLAISNHTKQLQENHQAFLSLACHTSTGKVRQTSNFARHHSKTLVSYARSVVQDVEGGLKNAFRSEVGDMEKICVSPLMRTRLEKAAADSGFDMPAELVADGLRLRSTRFPEHVTVKAFDSDGFAISASSALLLPGTDGMRRTLSVHGWNALYEVLEKAAATGRTMPDRVAEVFQQLTRTLPKTTEAERLVVQRVGQGLFRGALLDYWQGRCCVTGLAVPELLRASHIKPWAQCEADEERLDVFNGLLLAPHLDALFDAGWITFDEAGVVVISRGLPTAAVQLLGVSTEMHIDSLMSSHQAYMGFHRDVVFKD